MPHINPAVLGCARLLCRGYLRGKLKITELRIAPADRVRLERLRGERVVLTPNHPSFDPVVIFELSTRLGQAFHYLTARELFDNPVQAFVISRIGAYAIRRGTHDDSALHTSRQLIRDGQHWLVLFPEGEAHYLHDTVLPFLPGAARLGLGALADLAQQQSPPPPVYLVPLALRYHYSANMRRAMLRSLAQLEQGIGLSAPDSERGEDWHYRLGRIADHVLDCNEFAVGISATQDANLQQRLDYLRELILARAAGALGIEVPPPGAPLRNRLRKVFAAAKHISHHPPETGGAYARQLYARRCKHTALLKQELERVLSFLALTGTYSYDVPTVENYMDVLGRLELEVFGKQHYWGPRCVTVRVGEPVDLRQHLAAFRDDPESASAAVMQQVEQAVRDMLAETRSLMNPLPER